MILKQDRYRIRWIDIAKGWGIVLVVVGHVISGFQSSGLYEDNGFFKDVAYYIYTFHMPLFMVISGLLFSLKRINDREAEVKKVLVSYGVPYILFSFIWAMSKIVLQSHTTNKLTIKDMLLIPLYGFNRGRGCKTLC